MTTEEKAKAYAEKELVRTIRRHAHSFDVFVPYFDSEDIQQAYLAGATEVLASQWVSVEERLPEFNERVLVCCVEYGRPSMFIAQRIPHDTAGRNNTRWHWTQVIRDESITHWLPIPPLKGDPDTFDETDK